MECDTVTDADALSCFSPDHTNSGENKNDTQSWTIRSYRPLRAWRAFGRARDHRNSWRMGLPGPDLRWHCIHELLPHLPGIWSEDLQRLLTRSCQLLVVAMVLLVTAATPIKADTPIISAADASRQMETGDLVVLDIRTPQEWAETGIADGAWPVSMHTPEFPQQLQAILSQYRTSEIALICATGGRTAYVTEILEKNGIVGVADVSEGMFGNGEAPGWMARGLPIVSSVEAMADYTRSRQAWSE